MGVYKQLDESDTLHHILTIGNTSAVCLSYTHAHTRLYIYLSEDTPLHNTFPRQSITLTLTIQTKCLTLTLKSSPNHKTAHWKSEDCSKGPHTVGSMLKMVPTKIEVQEHTYKHHFHCLLLSVEKWLSVVSNRRFYSATGFEVKTMNLAISIWTCI